MRLPTLTAAQERRVRKTIREIEEAVDETVEDQGEYLEVGRDDIYFDMVPAIVGMLDPWDEAVAYEVCRRTLGYVPVSLTSLMKHEDWLE